MSRDAIHLSYIKFTKVYTGYKKSYEALSFLQVGYTSELGKGNFCDGTINAEST